MGKVPLERAMGIPKRKKRTVNVSDIARFDEVAVPCKVCGMGELGKPVVVYAKAFSRTAREKIEKAGGKALPLEEAPENVEVLRCWK